MTDLPDKPITISIDGKKLPSFKSFQLRQAINEHHYFEVLLDYEAGEVFQAATLKNSTAWLGKIIEINIGEKNFVGVVAQVGLHKSGGYTFVKVTGFSTTYRLEGDLHFASWNDKSLEDIVSELTEKANVKADIKPENTSKLEYECQYQESGFGFIRRLAKQHLEWMFYDGEKLIFGKPELKKVATLDSKADLKSLEICVQTEARPLSAFSHISGSNNMINATSPDEPTGFNNLGVQAFQQSLSIFREPANQYALPRVKGKGQLDDYLKRKQQADAAMSHYITAECDYVGLMLGSVVDIKSTIQVTGIGYKEESLGAYVIIDITHFGEEPNRYSCQFTAIPASVKNIPAPDVPFPVAQPQMATVISNEDPKGQGRVQVRMNWQIKGMKTSWIRVLTPDAGGSDKVASNRGFVFIPEKGDQVMVAFRYNDPNRPYVQGSMFNGTNAGGGGENNNVKSLTTRSGCVISLDDKKGSITISDPSGNVVFMDGNKNVTVSAKETLTLQAKDIIINANENLGMKATTTINTADSIGISAENDVTISGGETALLNSKQTNVHGYENIDLSSKTINSQSKNDTSITASIIKLNS